MTEEQKRPPDEPPYVRAKRSAWVTFAKILLFLVAGVVVLIVLVLGTCAGWFK